VVGVLAIIFMNGCDDNIWSKCQKDFTLRLHTRKRRIHYSSTNLLFYPRVVSILCG